MKKRAAVLFTGGKDSTCAIQLMRERGYSIACLVTILSENQESYMLHTASIETTKLSSIALDIPLFVGRTKGIREEEVEDISVSIDSARREHEFGTIASGGNASNYQKVRIQSIADKLGLSLESPLWGVDQSNYLHDLVRRGYKFILTSVSAEGLDKSWLGKEIDSNSVTEIISLSKRFGFNPSFEGGEAETLVLDCPLFGKKMLRIVSSDIDWHGSYGRLMIKQVELVPK